MVVIKQPDINIENYTIKKIAVQCQCQARFTIILESSIICLSFSLIQDSLSFALNKPQHMV